MEINHKRMQMSGNLAFFFSGICAISSGVVVSLLQERFGFAYGMTGTLLSLMSIGNLLASFAAGMLPGRIGMKKSVLLLTTGYGIGYLLMTLTGQIGVLMLAFLLVGIAKGSALNTCTVMVGNHADNKTKGMNIMHACYACGALLCPFVISIALFGGTWLPTIVLAVLGIVVWTIFGTAGLSSTTAKADGKKIDWSFLKSGKFWVLTGLLFCQNAAETSVTGWLVTYFKGNGILSGTLSTYTVTVMWGATLLARLLIAFVLPIKNAAKAMIGMGLGCTVLYFGLIQAQSGVAAIVMLFLFAASMAGMNPTAVACAGKQLNVTSMGIMLPVAALGAILMPWIIGIVAEHVNLQVGMMCNIVPCAGLLVFGLLSLKYLGKAEEA
ncbi:MAG: MFS transporter [Lachnospiraceae bacterium]|nr:MFS transporter [Lachnospiraceae bacterium]